MRPFLAVVLMGIAMLALGSYDKLRRVEAPSSATTPSGPS